MATAIDIGPGATNRGTSVTYGLTVITLGNPANETGTLNTFEVWAVTNVAGLLIGTFSGAGTSYDDRDYENIGAVTSGSKQTFTGKNCDVSTGDYLGFYFTSGSIEHDTSGGDGIYYKTNSQFGTGSQTYTLQSGRASSIYATGSTDAPAAGNPWYYYAQQ